MAELFDSHRFCIAPMLGYTDRHFRYLFRLISKHALLYSEMITTGALLWGKKTERMLAFHEQEHPVALQLGGNQPHELAQCAKLGERAGYDEINLNAGCPSPRVQAGNFGAALMKTPQRIVECVKAMQDAVDLPVTVKIRLGIDGEADKNAHDLIAMLSEAGCQYFIIHARLAHLKNISPKKNRSEVALSYEKVYEIKKAFPQRHIIINGGIQKLSAMETHLKYVDGVMVGQAAYHDPYAFIEADRTLWEDVSAKLATRQEILAQYFTYVQSQLQEEKDIQRMLRHCFGLFKGQPGASKIRRYLSECRSINLDKVQAIFVE